MKFSVYLGRTSGPLVAIGKNQCLMLGFAEKFRGWHTLGKDKATRRAADGLNRRGCIVISGGQFRLREPSDAK